MLLPDQQSAVSRYAMRYLEMLRNAPDGDPTQRLGKVQRLIDDYAAMMDARLIVIEDLEAAMMWPGYWGTLQVARRLLARYCDRCWDYMESEHGSEVPLAELFDAARRNIDPELLKSGLRHARPDLRE